MEALLYEGIEAKCGYYLIYSCIGGVFHNHEGQVKLTFTQVLTHSPTSKHAKYEKDFGRKNNLILVISLLTVIIKR